MAIVGAFSSAPSERAAQLASPLQGASLTGPVKSLRER
jgi:hypothetical protein